MANTQPVWPGWDIVKCIGKGGFGAVYELRQEVFGDVERCALKVITIPHDHNEIEYMRCEGLDDESISSTLESQVGDIVKEYKFMKKMGDNPNIVHCDEFRYSRHEEDLGWDIYIKMELLTPLMKVLDRMQDEKEIIRLGIELCNALVGCQKLNIIHRDIKPQNIFLSPSGYYKLGDFGIARTMEHTTKATAGIGTYSFMAPEVANGKTYSSTVDIYSLGLVLYWLLNERRGPFVPLPPQKPTFAENENARMRRYSGEKLPAPKHGSDELKTVVLKACEFDPKNRYQTAEDMMRALKQIGRPSVKTEEAPAVKQKIKTGKRKKSADSAEDRTKTAIDRGLGNPPAQKEQDASDSDRDLTVIDRIKKENEEREVHKPSLRNKIIRITLPIAAVIVFLLAIRFAVRNMKPKVQDVPQTEQAQLQEIPQESTAVTIPTETVPVTEAEPAWKDNMLMSDLVGDTEGFPALCNVFGSEYTRHQILSVSFLDSKIGAPNNAWDVSITKNGSVIAWVEEKETNSILQKYDLFIAADGGVNGAEACEDLFKGYEELSQIHFNGNFYTDEARSMKSMFYDCEHLTSLDVSSFITDNVTDMSEMFLGCKEIDSLDVSNFNTDNVTSMNKMFYLCQDVCTLDLRNFDTKSVTDMGEMFCSCYMLSEINVSSFDTSNVTNMENMFGSTSIKQLDVSSFNTSNVTDMFAMFCGCNDLVELDIRNFDTSNAKRLSMMFYGCTKLEKLTLGTLDATNCDNLSNMFSACKALSELYFDEMLTLGVSDWNAMFSGCASLTELDLSSLDTSNAETFRYMFNNCSSLVALNLSSFNTSEVTVMERMFYGCNNLQNPDLSHFDFSNVKYHDKFMNNGQLVNGRPWEELFQ